MDLEIRSPTNADRTSIADAHRDSIAGVEAYTEEQRTAWREAVDPARYPLEEPTAVVRVAERDGRIVGFGWLTLEPAASTFVDPVDAELTAVYVRQSATGTGVGSALLDRLESVARDRGCEAVGVWASRPAVPFYERHGYERVTDRTFSFGSVDVPVLEMRTRLE